ncbi:MAG: hypothetical protein HQ541_23530 [Mariniphaga sp.]|nr:hypothetical protein [Mariniphaga sp.]
MKKTFITVRIIFSVMIVFISCEDEYGGDRVLISSFNDMDSHKDGQNCMSCHISGGKGKGWFTVAGTVYNASLTSVYINSTVKLYKDSISSGTLVKTIEVDGKGNFYTTDNVDFGNGLYATVTGTSGNIKPMVSSFLTGQCNSCHGIFTGKIWAE